MEQSSKSSSKKKSKPQVVSKKAFKEDMYDYEDTNMDELQEYYENAMSEFIDLARDVEYGCEIDVETLDTAANNGVGQVVLTQQEVDKIIKEAEQIIDELVEVEERLIRFHLGQAKKIMCQFCEHRGRSIIEERNSISSYLLAGILVILLGWIGVLLTPFCFGLLRQQLHRCPKCLNAIKEKSLFSSLEDNILQVQIGKFGILVKRRTLAQALVFIVLAICGYYLFNHMYMSPEDKHKNYQVDYTITWSQFLTDCGKSTQYEAAKRHFNYRYAHKYIQWEGHVMRIDGNELNYLHQASILLLMSPRDAHPKEPDFADREPDIILTFDLYSFEQNKAVIEELHRGDYIQFNATISSIAQKRGNSLTKYHSNDEESTHHIHAIDIIKLRSDGVEAVGKHIHWDGRYQFNSELQNEDFHQTNHVTH